MVKTTENVDFFSWIFLEKKEKKTPWQDVSPYCNDWKAKAKTNSGWKGQGIGASYHGMDWKGSSQKATSFRWRKLYQIYQVSSTIRLKSKDAWLPDKP